MLAAKPHEDIPFLGVIEAPSEVRAVPDLVSWGTAHKADLRRALVQHGALLLRGFPMREPPDFGAFFATQEAHGLHYAGGFTVRQQVHEGVYTSTAAPPMVSIPLHNEMAYLPDYPHRVYLFCAQPAARGGQTPLADGRRVLSRVDARLVSRLRERGVRYVRNLPPLPGRIWPATGWRKAFGAEAPEPAEKAARELGYDVDWFGDVMRISNLGPVSRVHPETGEEVWFSQMHNFHHSNSAEFWHAGQILGWALFRWIEGRERRRLPEDRLSVAVLDGEGVPVSHEEALGVRQAIWRETRMFDWQAGDLLIADNLLVLHGRRPFRGERRVYAALAKD
jgi:alpha-ketoglutarate-dependent taurine dioxygenase